MTKGGVYVATPRSGEPNTRYWHGIIALEAWCIRNRIPILYREASDKNGVATNHNQLIADFLSKEHEWMLMLDADALIQPAALGRMLGRSKQVVAPLMFQRKPPYMPTVHLRREGPPEENRWSNDWGWLWEWCEAHIEQVAVMDRPVLLQEVRGEPLVQVKRAGTHVMLVHRDVLEAIEPPWFEALKESGSGSDFDFCSKVLDAGFGLWCDKSIFAGHLQGDYCTGVLDWLIWSQHTRQSAEQRGVAVKVAEGAA